MPAGPLDQRREQSFVEECRETFHRVGLKTTYARLAVAQFLAGTSGAVSIGDVMKGVGTAQLDRGTVARVLQAFSQVGFVQNRVASEIYVRTRKIEQSPIRC